MRIPTKIKHLKSIFFCCLVLLLSTVAQAEKSYISDVLIVTLRSGPGNSFRIIKALKTGVSFKVLEEKDKYLKIITDDGVEGWLQKQYTSKNPPSILKIQNLKNQVNASSDQLKKLTSTNQSLTEELKIKGSQLNQLNNEFSQSISENNNKLQNLQSEHDSIQNQYNNVIIEAKDSIATKNELDRYKKDYTNLLNRNSSLEEKTESLADRNNIYWFLSGVGVLLLGMIIGRLGGKKQKSLLS